MKQNICTFLVWSFLSLIVGNEAARIINPTSRPRQSSPPIQRPTTKRIQPRILAITTTTTKAPTKVATFGHPSEWLFMNGSAGLPLDFVIEDDPTTTDFVSNDNDNGRKMVIVWRNPYPLDNYTEMLLLGRDGGGDEDHYQPPHPHEFDEMEQRDLLRTVIFLANAQMNIKFKLCEMRRFRSDFRPRWNLYRCAARFTVTRIGKECHPENTYDGYVNFIVQNPELPPLLSIRYYVFQFLYEEAFGFVKKINEQQRQQLPQGQIQFQQQLH